MIPETAMHGTIPLLQLSLPITFPIAMLDPLRRLHEVIALNGSGQWTNFSLSLDFFFSPCTLPQGS